MLSRRAHANLHHWPTASLCGDSLKVFTSYFLFTFYVITPLLIGFASSLDTLTFLLWRPNSIPDHSWVNHLQKPYQFILHFEFCATFPFCIISVFRRFHNPSMATPRVFSYSPLCLQPAFDCFPSCVLLLHVCDAMLVVAAKSVKQQAMTGRVQSHQLLLLCSHLLHVCVNKWACKHVVTLLRLCAPRWAQLWCSFRLTSGSSFIRNPLDWRTQTQPLKSGKRGEKAGGVCSQSKSRVSSHIITFPGAIFQLAHYRSAWNLTHCAFLQLG